MAADAGSDPGGISRDELQLATRNHGMPLEALRYPVTPVGLHYTLVHYDIPVVDPERWRLTVDGQVDRPLSLTLDDLRARPRRSVTVTMECAGNGRALLDPRPHSQPWLVEAVGTATWTGTPLAAVLDDAGLLDDAVEVRFTGIDRGVEGGTEQAFARSLPIDEVGRDEVILADELNGEPLPVQHGFPLRLVVPGWYGMTNVKWLTQVTALDRPFDGYQQAVAYRWRADEEDPGRPLTRMAPRALMVPPGIVDFMTRHRFVEEAPVTLEGRAWSGFGPITRVDCSADGGTTWHEADLDDELSRWAWRRWSYTWHPPGPGTYELACRARDAAGNEQPIDATWNAGGYSNNGIHRVPVTVGSPGG